MFSLGETIEFLLGNPFSTPVGQRIGKSLLLWNYFGVLTVGLRITRFHFLDPKIMTVLKYNPSGQEKIQKNKANF